MYVKSLNLSGTKSPVSLIVHGQGVFVFDCSGEPCKFTLFNADRSNGLRVSFEFAHVQVTGIQSKESLLDPNNKKGLSNIKGAYYWFSLDSQNQRLTAGVGEPRLETAVYTYTFSDANKILWELNKGFLESLVSIEYKSIAPRRLLRDPITIKLPLLVKNTDELSMNDIAKGEVYRTQTCLRRGSNYITVFLVDALYLMMQIFPILPRRLNIALRLLVSGAISD